jgi:hypothetical protein
MFEGANVVRDRSARGVDALAADGADQGGTQTAPAGHATGRGHHA